MLALFIWFLMAATISPQESLAVENLADLPEQNYTSLFYMDFSNYRDLVEADELFATKFPQSLVEESFASVPEWILKNTTQASGGRVAREVEDQSSTGSLVNISLTDTNGMKKEYTLQLKILISGRLSVAPGEDIVQLRRLAKDHEYKGHYVYFNESDLQPTFFALIANQYFISTDKELVHLCLDTYYGDGGRFGDTDLFAMVQSEIRNQEAPFYSFMLPRTTTALQLDFARKLGVIESDITRLEATLNSEPIYQYSAVSPTSEGMLLQRRVIAFSGTEQLEKTFQQMKQGIQRTVTARADEGSIAGKYYDALAKSMSISSDEKTRMIIEQRYTSDLIDLEQAYNQAQRADREKQNQ